MPAISLTVPRKHSNPISLTTEESTQTSQWLLDQITKDAPDKSEKKAPKPWSKLNPCRKFLRVWGILFRVILLFVILYFFICSLGLLEDSFKLLGGRAAGEAFRNSDLLSNPVTGLMIGVLATVLVQSSSTATSIVVAMVASGVIPLRAAIPIIMGTNIGTSVTSTLVALAQAGERQEFRRAFAGATVHDMFNWSAVILLLPIEVATGYLYHLTKAIVDSMQLQSGDHKIEMLTAITKPLTKRIVEVNKGVIKDIAMSPNATASSSVMKRWCKIVMVSEEVTRIRFEPVRTDCSQVGPEDPFYLGCTSMQHGETFKNVPNFYVGWNYTELVNKTIHRSRCSSLFAQTDLADNVAGAILLVISIFIILSSLFGIVKILNSVLQGPVAQVIHRTVNADFPGRLSCLTGYVAIMVGCGMTIIIQSSSVFTSTLTPLVGVGIVSVERMYPMTLGSNIGTTVTGILAALSTKGDSLPPALQIALCHLFFNISAVLIFYPIPFMRFPISLAKVLGRVTSKYRWFAGFYLAMMFLLMPGAVFALSYAGFEYLLGIGGPIFLLFLVVTLINVLQVKRPHWLPVKLRNWDFLPLCCHSCRPIDKVVTCQCFSHYCEDDDDEDHSACNGGDYMLEKTTRESPDGGSHYTHVANSPV